MVVTLLVSHEFNAWLKDKEQKIQAKADKLKAKEKAEKEKQLKIEEEVNQARAAGYFGWPYFIGNNYAYHDYDFAAQKASNESFDPQKRHYSTDLASFC